MIALNNRRAREAIALQSALSLPVLKDRESCAKLMNEKLLLENVIVKHIAGSRSYGTDIPTSDKDIRGIFIADPVYYRTPFFNIGEINIPNEEDGKLYELNKFTSLCAECNPNIMETLWVDEKDVIMKTKSYDILRHFREEFLSTKAATKYTGFADEQLKRIKGHNKWISNPQSIAPPRQIDYVSLVRNYTENKLLPRDFKLANFKNNWRLIPYGHDIFGLTKMNGYQSFSDDFTLNTNCNHDDFNHPDLIVKFNKDVYVAAKDKWSNYWKWKENRNEERGLLEEKFGYDTRHASHLIRLLRMGLEIISTGQCMVRRTDAEELKAIRYDGIWTYEKVIDYSDSMKEKIKIALKTTKLPTEPNYEKLANVTISAQDVFFKQLANIKNNTLIK